MSVRTGVLAACLLMSGCGDEHAIVDPEARDVHAHVSEENVLPQVPFASVVAATFAVPKEEAGASLERYLEGRADTLLAAWPRTTAGRIDLDRAPLVATSLYASIGPGSKSRCGEVVVTFRGHEGPVLRARLPVPATVKACRGILRDNYVTGNDALPLLRAAIADAHVAVPAAQPTIAAN